MRELTTPAEDFISQIYLIRGQRVMLDSDLAAIYNVSTTRFNQQVQRNIKRFPPEFMFQLTTEEFSNLMLQNATSSWGGRRKLPYVFIEHGAVMAASVLNTDAAIQASIFVVKAFVQLRNVMVMYKELEQRLLELERTTREQFQEQDEKMDRVFDLIRQFVQVNQQPRKLIGFKRNEDE